MGDHADKLSRIPPLPHDEDERPRREDLRSSNPFAIPVPIPRWLRPKRERRSRPDQ